ncbi:MAG: MBL fold metallo-hydrolase, partial [Firmicutes bacterium]|nr:MBL fold metallo-hydrolase [Bacillota bacterium]
MISFATLFSSSKGNSVFVSGGKTKILVDAGMPACHIENALSQIGESMKDIAALMITHEHQDHIGGVGVMSRRYGLPVYANQKTW